jgi:hypothetical protein
MIEILIISSRMHLKILLPLFLKSASSSYLRKLAHEFGESTNSVRVELNNLTRAGYLQAFPAGRTMRYRANESHPIFPELQRLVRKYFGNDRIVEQVLYRLGEVDCAYVTGDYAEGRDTGTIEVLLVGVVNQVYLKRVLEKARPLLPRKIKVRVLTREEFYNMESMMVPRLLIHKADE